MLPTGLSSKESVMKPTYDELLRKNALLEASLREIIRLDDATVHSNCKGCIPPEDAFVGRHLTQWRNIIRKSRSLV